MNSNSITSHALRAMSAGMRQRRHRDSESCRIIADRIADSLLYAEQKKSGPTRTGQSVALRDGGRKMHSPRSVVVVRIVIAGQ